jgi:hypothetical protein
LGFLGKKSHGSLRYNGGVTITIDFSKKNNFSSEGAKYLNSPGASEFICSVSHSRRKGIRPMRVLRHQQSQDIIVRPHTRTCNILLPGTPARNFNRSTGRGQSKKKGLSHILRVDSAEPPPLFKKERFQGPPKHSNHPKKVVYNRFWRILCLTVLTVFSWIFKTGGGSAESAFNI